MKKIIKLLVIALALVCAFSLVACDSLNDTEKAARTYMSEHAEDYSNFNTKSGLKYTSTVDKPSIGLISFDGSYTIIYDFKSKKGTCSATLASDEYLFTFSGSYDYENSSLTFNVEKVTKSANDNMLSTIESIAKAEISVAYSTVQSAASK